ncbi:MAG: hypothetical protein QHI48_08815 [Bacteroidota bacterium]|nr:hypothetical protein [Bacteroidota bacterium]
MQRRHIQAVACILAVMVAFFPHPGWSASQQDPIISDHRAVEAFASITDSQRTAAAALRMMFRHASVGAAIDAGMECIQGTRRNCPESFPPYLFDRRNWIFQPRGNSGWYGKMDDFRTEVDRQLDSFSVFSFKYCYLDGLDELAEPCGKFDPTKIGAAWEYLRSGMEALERAHPEKVFVWWTIPLTQIGQHCTDTLNQLIREYVRQNGKILLDIADIECHDPQGVRQLGEKGWERAYGPYCGEAGPACHPKDEGALRIAKGIWWMMVQVAMKRVTTAAHFPPADIDFVEVHPNPSGGTVNVRLSLRRGGRVTLDFVDVLGRSTKRCEYDVEAGAHTMAIDASALPPGIYLLRSPRTARPLLVSIIR